MSATNNTANYSELTNEASEILNPKFWVKSPGFDLSLVTGGAFFTLGVAAIAFQVPQYLPIFFWIWVVAFEGSHFWATFSRTYIDSEYRKTNAKVLYASLVFFLFPFLAVLADASQSSISYMSLYGFFIFVWSLYHNARQHYGFMSIYTGKAKIHSELKSKMTKTLYFSVCSAQAYFLLNFKIQGAFGLATAASVSPNLDFLVAKLPIIFSIGSIAYFFYLTKELIEKVGKKALIGMYYIGVCWLFYSTMFYVVAPMDTLFQSMSGAETLMLIAIMNSLFHNIQYHAIVWYYGNKRYNEEKVEQKSYGIARFVNYKTANYLGFALLMGAVFGFITWNVGDWPAPNGSWAMTQASHWAYVLFFGIIGHHFYLDQKIWRPSTQKELRSYLDLKQES